MVEFRFVTTTILPSTAVPANLAAVLKVVAGNE